MTPLANVEDAVVEDTFRRSVLIPPTKVEVAVEVELIAATVGVDVETMFPLASVEMSMFASIPESVKFVALRFVANRLVEVAFVVVPVLTVRS